MYIYINVFIYVYVIYPSTMGLIAIQDRKLRAPRIVDFTCNPKDDDNKKDDDKNNNT